MSGYRDIFTTVREALGPPFLGKVIAELLPGGRIVGSEYICGSLAGGSGKSCSTNVISGRGSDFNTGEAWDSVIGLAAQVWRVERLEAAKRLAYRYSIIFDGENRATARRGTVPVDCVRYEYEAVAPIPSNAPPRRKDHPQKGEPVTWWHYLDGAGRVLHYVARFEHGGGKEILPLILCREAGSGKLLWQWKHLPKPRPLYNLRWLARASPEAAVLLVEGEKSADAAQLLFPDYVCMTWSGGAQAVKVADFTPLQNRRVLIWPDNDAPGFKAALLVTEQLQKLGNNPGIIVPPDFLSEKWDVADNPPDGFDPREFIASTEKLAPPIFAETAARRFPEFALRAVEHVERPAAQSASNCDSIRPWPILSPDALPGLAGDFVNLATRDSEADPAAVLATLLARFGAEVYAHRPGLGPFVRVGETAHPPRLFVAICGATAKARKGTSARPVLRLFKLPVGDNSSVPTTPFTGGPLSSGEGLAFRLRDSEDASQNKSGKKDEGQQAEPSDKRLFVLDEELAAALANMRREGNILSMTLRSFWDSGDYEPLTKNEQIRVSGAHVCIVTHITTREVRRGMDNVQIANGFANRFIWACARRGKLVPRPLPMPDNEFLPLQKEMWRRVRLAQGRTEVHFTADALALWENMYPALSEDIPGAGGQLTARAEAQSLRLALVYALLDGSDNIDAPHLAAATAFWRYARDSALYIFGGEEEDDLGGRIVATLAGGPKSTTELHAAFCGHIPSRRLKTCLQELIGQGLVLAHEERTSGRPKMVYVCAEKDNLRKNNNYK